MTDVNAKWTACQDSANDGISAVEMDITLNESKQHVNMEENCGEIRNKGLALSAAEVV